MGVQNAFCWINREVPSRFEQRILTIGGAVMRFDESFATTPATEFHLRLRRCGSTETKSNIAMKRHQMEAGFASLPGIPRPFLQSRTSCVLRCATPCIAGVLRLISSETRP